jgi:hypothetical protein
MTVNGDGRAVDQPVDSAVLVDDPGHDFVNFQPTAYVNRYGRRRPAKRADPHGGSFGRVTADISGEDVRSIPSQPFGRCLPNTASRSRYESYVLFTIHRISDG